MLVSVQELDAGQVISLSSSAIACFLISIHLARSNGKGSNYRRGWVWQAGCKDSHRRDLLSIFNDVSEPFVLSSLHYTLHDRETVKPA